MTGEPSIDLSISDWRQIDGICDRFEHSLRAERSPSIEKCIEEVAAPARGRLLRELILLEIEYRGGVDRGSFRTEYHARFPDDSQAVDDAFNNLSEVPDYDQNVDADAETLEFPAGWNPLGDPQATADLPKAETAGDKNLGRVIGVYRLVERLGRGGMGSVYRATHTAIQSERAIKLLRPALAKNPLAVQRFLREAQAAINHLSHPNIVKTFDLLCDDEEFYLVMELIVGCDLARLIKRRGALPAYQATIFIEQAAAGLAFAHEKGFVHRDIKPHNLMLATDGTIKLLDLGLIRALHSSEAADAASESLAGEAKVGGPPALAGMTEGHSVFGTLPYMSPEQTHSTRDADARSDLYSLGCTLYYLLTGRPAFVGATTDELIAAVRANKFPRPRAVCSGIPPSLEHIVLRLMSPRPEDRFPSAQQLARTLRSWRLQEQLGESAPTIDSFNYQSAEELKAILLGLRIISAQDWDDAKQMLAAQPSGEFRGETLVLVDSASSQDRRHADRALDGLGVLYHSARGSRGLSEWQKHQIAMGNADLLRMPCHVLVGKIGFGWMGEVFRARNIETGQIESLRTFSASALSGLRGDESDRLRNFLSEADRISRIEHAVFPKVMSFDSCRNRIHFRLAYLATEFVHGRTAADYVRSNRWSSPEHRNGWALRVIAQLARGLEVAHRQGVFHSDIHHDRLRLTNSGDVKLTDLGIATLVRPLPVDTTFSACLAMGTASYMSPEESAGAGEECFADAIDDSDTVQRTSPPLFGSSAVMPPEQWLDRRNVSVSTDIYNLGCVLCYLITGRYPFEGQSHLELMRMVVSKEKLRAPRDIPPRIRSVAETALAIDPSNRFSSAGQLADVLDETAELFPCEMNELPANSWWRRTWQRIRRQPSPTSHANPR